MRPGALWVSSAVTAEIEIRRAREDDAESIGPLWTASFNLPASFAAQFPARFHPERVLVAAEGSRVIATAQAYATRQWFGGRPLETAAVASVATDALYRGSGVAPRVLKRLLEEAREAGQVYSSLYPSTVPFYRRLGYEYGGVYTVYRVPLAELPAGRSTWESGAAELTAMPEDDESLRASFRRLAERENGMVEGLEDDWWRLRVFGRHSEEEPGGTVTTSEEVPHGYAAYRQERLGGSLEGYRLACTHLVAHTPLAARALLGFFRRFKGVGQELTWQGPPSEPLAFVVPEQSVGPIRTFRFMSRILDVPGALEGRGYPEVEGEARFGVHDPTFPEAGGTFQLEAGGGKVKVTRLDEAPAGKGAIPIGVLTTMFAGYVTPDAASRMGLVDPEHPALPLFRRLFAGPPPWTPDFF